MKTIKLLAALMILAVSTKGQKTATLQFGQFSKINVTSIATVYVKLDSVQSVKVVGSLINSDEAHVSNQTLFIDNSTNNTYFISVQRLDEVNVDGKADVYSESTITADDIQLRINGNGKIKMDLNAGKVKATVPGAGKIEIAGTAEEATFSVPGSGKIDAEGLKVKKADASISGIGKISVDATDELNSNVSGSGTITYKSLPKNANENISGIGKIKMSDNASGADKKDTTRINFGDTQLWVIGKQEEVKIKRSHTKPIWAGFEMGLNSYMDNGGTFKLSPGKENFELRVEKSVSVGLNLLQKNIELGNSNVWFFTGLGITWNNYRFDNDILLTKGDYTTAYHDTTPGVGHIKSKLVTTYLTAPLMFEVFTSRKYKNAFHVGVGGIVGLLIGSHTKQKTEFEGETSKQKDFSNHNVNPFRYGFRAAIGYGRFNIFADYYASTMFKHNEGPVLYPVNAGITFIGF